MYDVMRVKVDAASSASATASSVSADDLPSALTAAFAVEATALSDVSSSDPAAGTFSAAPVINATASLDNAASWMLQIGRILDSEAPLSQGDMRLANGFLRNAFISLRITWRQLEGPPARWLADDGGGD